MFAVRCILGFNSGPPMNPAGYNQNVQIAQTEDHVLLLNEMVHSSRIIPLDGRPHLPDGVRQWMGDSRGRWEGETLVVETTNFRDTPAFSQGSENMKVTERFRLESADSLIYTFTVEDPTVWTAPFTGEYSWHRTDNKVFEYACHEANYSFEGIMRGARLLEAEFRGEEPEGVVNPTR